MSTFKNVSTRKTLIALLLPIVFTACTANDKDAAAVVDGAVITNHAILEAAPVADAAARQHQLEVFITEQLFANAAVKQNIQVLQPSATQDENQRRKALANAYVARKVADFPRPSTESIRAFYDENPALFKQRRIYRLQEIAVQAPADQVDKITVMFPKLLTFAKRVEWLKKEHLAYVTNVKVASAEDLPSDMLTILSTAHDGAAFDLRTATGVSSIQITGIEEAPISMAQARPAIEAYIKNIRGQKLFIEETGRLRAAAKIQYFAPYAGTAPRENS